MQPLSKAAEAKILSAIEQTADLVNEGLEPSAAVAKAASAGGLPTGHINLLVHAYNTGRTTRQRQLGEDVLEKAADFPLADASRVLELLYPTQVKTAAQLARSAAISTEYAIPPGDMIRRRSERQKQAEALARPLPPLLEAPPPPLQRDPQERLKRAYNRSVENTRAIDEARRQVTMAEVSAIAGLDAVRDYFKQARAMAYGDALKEVEYRSGRLGVAVLEQIAAVMPQLTKQAATGAVHMGRDPLYDLVTTAVKAASHYVERRQHYDQVAHERSRDTEDTLRPFVVPLPQSILAGLSSPEKQAAGPLAWGAAGGTAKDILKSLATNLTPPTSDLLQDQMNDLTDPNHESQLRNIRTQAMLQDLMANDQVIKGHPPQESIQAFNEIGEVAPRAVDQRLIMQTLMRKRLTQGHLDPFEVDQLLGMEGKLRQRDEGIPNASIMQ